MILSNLPSRAWNKLMRSSDRLALFMYSCVNTGDTVQCELCGWKGRSLFEGQCPRCSSRPRTRLMPYAMDYFHLDATDKVLLHLGPNKPEIAWLANHKCPKLHICADLLHFPFNNLMCDATRLPLASNSVDLVIAWHVLEHIPDDRGVMREMRRVLRPGARVLMSVPIATPYLPQTYEDKAVQREKFLEAYGHEDHVRACGLDYGQRFVEEGFAVQELRMWELDNARKKDLEIYGLSMHHVVWCFRKPEQ